MIFISGKIKKIPKFWYLIEFQFKFMNFIQFTLKKNNWVKEEKNKK